MEKLIETPDVTKRLLGRIRQLFKKDILPELKKREYPGARRRRHQHQSRIAHPQIPLANAILADMEAMRFGFEIVGVQIIGRTTDTFEFSIVLDTKKQKYGERERWNFLGGHVLPGEEIAETAIRETFEEGGMDIRLNPLKRVGFVRLHPRPGATAAAYAAVFFTVITPEQRKGAHPGDEQEKDGLKFVSEVELKRMISQRQFQTNHANGYREFKRWLANAIQQMTR